MESAMDQYKTSERRRRNLITLFNNTTVMPFKFAGKYICFFCGQKFEDYSNLRQHTNSHRPCSLKELKMIKGANIEVKIDVSDISCLICEEPFKNLSEIIHHLIVKHHIEYDRAVDNYMKDYKLINFTCIHCDKQFTNIGDLFSHMNLKHEQSTNNFICDLCGVTLETKISLIKHLKSCKKEGSQQGKCKKAPSSTKLIKDLKKRDLVKHFFECKFCNKKLVSKDDLKHHIINWHKNNDLIKSEKLILKVDTKVSSEYKQKQDLLKIRENIVCVLNSSTAVPFKFFTKYSCFFCSKSFLDFDELKSHTNIEHPVCDTKFKSLKRCRGERTSIKIDISNLACKLCGEAIDNVDTLTNHLISLHNATYHKTITDCFEPFRVQKDNIPCPSCGKVFRYFSILQRHINSDHSSNKHICTYCGKGFIKATNLNVHISYIHKGAVECDICLEKFRNPWCLARHKAKQHDAKEFKCSKCSGMFQSQYHKQKHMIEAHGIGFKCTYCGKMFTRNSFMKDHIRRTHLKEKNVPCSVCDEKFFDKYLLKLHMAKHDGERKFSCSVCGKSFLRRSNLYSHLEMHKKYGHLQTV